jgi:hypothetical protein
VEKNQKFVSQQGAAQAGAHGWAAKPALAATQWHCAMSHSIAWHPYRKYFTTLKMAENNMGENDIEK